MKRAWLIAPFVLAAALSATPSFAAENPADGTVVLQMADGLFYHPQTGLSAVSREALLALIEARGSGQPAVEPTPQDPAPAPAPDAAPVPERGARLKDAVVRGRAMIAERIAAQRAERKKPLQVASTDVWVDIALAVWDEATDEIAIVPAGKNGTKLDLHLPDGAMKAAVRRSNGVNSHFVVDDGRKVVVAVQYPIFKEKWITSKKRVYELEDVVYTPYSRELHTPEMAAWGQATIDAMIAQAYDDLRQMGIRSRAFPDRLVVDVIDPELVKAIAVIEHLSETSLAGENAQAAQESFYVIMAGNQDKAYAYSRSSAGAKGLVQFIPSTYKLMVKRKELQLNPDFETGMADPRNAIRAQIAYLDAELAGMPLAVKDLAAVDPRRVDEYLAAAYNGGGARVRKAIKALGDDWSSDPTAKTAELQRRYDALFAQADSLKKKILAEEDPAVWKPMQAKLNKLRADRRAVQAQIDAIKSSSLRRETALYVQKLRNVLRLWNPPPVIS